MKALPLLFTLAAACGGSQAVSPTPAAPPPAAPADAPAAPAPLPAAPKDPDMAAVEAARPSLRACYDKARAANPQLTHAIVKLTMRVEPAGQVSTVDLEYTHRFDEASKGCLRDAAFAIKMPPGDARKVVVPMTFESK
ncbi:MAG TPA: hypothetical protein VGI39_37230 [Polyangiaceae bacterium]